MYGMKQFVFSIQKYACLWAWECERVCASFSFFATLQVCSADVYVIAGDYVRVS